MKTAIVIGGTGMVGLELVKQLCLRTEYKEVKSLVRRRSGFSHPKLTEILIDFDKPESYAEFVKGDTLFSSLGTTMARAKSKDAQYKVDFSYQFEVAEIASKQGVANYVLVSSAGARATAAAFYMKMKGQLEDAISTLPFQTISIIRPGQLDGDRTENRFFERISLKMMYFFNKAGLFKKFRPIHATQVASALINASLLQKSGTYTLEEVYNLVK